MKRFLILIALVGSLAAIVPTAANASAGWKYCGYKHGYSVLANHNTSCGFARNVAETAWYKGSTWPWSVRAYSNATGRVFTMYRTGYGLTYRGGNTAAVKLVY
jgi:hypothetical protein